MKKLPIAGTAGLLSSTAQLHSITSQISTGHHRRAKSSVAAGPHSALASPGHVSGFCGGLKTLTCTLGDIEDHIHLGVTENGGLTFGGPIISGLHVVAGTTSAPLSGAESESDVRLQESR